MLGGMRAASQSWIGRIVMALIMMVIVISFAIWGIGDIFSGFGANKLAQVGSTDITVEDFRNAYQVELQRMQREARRAITNDQARMLGIDRQVLGRLLNEAILDQETRTLGLAMSEPDVAKAITNDPTFHGITGHFDRQIFEGILRENGLNERRFVADQRQAYLRQQIVSAAIGGLQVPKAMLEAIHRYQSETRSVDYILLPPAAAGEIAPPSDADLQTYFDARRLSYRTPEYRKIVTLAVTPASLTKPDTVSDADAQKRYDADKARYATPETRAIEQIVFPDEASANEAAAKISGGATFDALMAERKLSEADVALGTVTPDKLADKAVRDAAFSLAEGQVSAPIKASFGTVLLRVTKINPAKTTPFAEVEPALKQDIARQRARSEMDRIHDAIEDQRASGKTLAEAAKTVGLEARMIDGVDAAGQAKDGAMVPDLAGGAALLKAVFASDIGVDNDTLSTPDGGTVWFEVAGIDPARQQTLEEVKPAVEKAWMDDEIAKRLSAKAGELVKRLDAGETLETIAAETGHLAVKHDGSVKRDGGAGLNAGTLAQIFNVNVKSAGSASADGGRILFQVLDAAVPPIDFEAADLRNLADQVKGGIADDIVLEFIGKFEHELGVKVNQQALQSALGGASPEGF